MRLQMIGRTETLLVGLALSLAACSSNPPIASTPTRPQLTAAQAENYTMEKYFAKAGNLKSLVADNWNPEKTGIGDVAGFKADFVIAADGSGSHKTVQAAIDAAIKAGGTKSRYYLEVKPGTYREVVCTKGAPPITLYSKEGDATKTVIAYNNANPTPKKGDESANPCNPNIGNAKGNLTFGTSGSASVAIYSDDFQAKNLSFANDYVEGSHQSGNQAAVALMTMADRLIFENVRFLGNQDTLYPKTAGVDVVQRSYFKDCYVEGDVDFIFGRGTAVFNNCEIRFLGGRSASESYIGAPSTFLDNPYGFLFQRCRFTADAKTPDNSVALLRQWFEGNVATNIGKMVVRDSVLGPHIRRDAPWAPWGTRVSPACTALADKCNSKTLVLYDSSNYYIAGTDNSNPPEQYLAEYRNTGPGATPTK